ncbi:MAG: Gfo/Idh/MocA family oxidoreductase [Lentisphaeria bacterium]
MPYPTRYAIVGLGGRHEMYRDAIITEFAGNSTLVALCDTNPARVELSVQRAAEKGASNLKGYAATGFDAMIAETQPDTVIVTTRDREHADYICRAMELGCDVIIEKPMTIDEVRCKRILETQARTGRTVTVTFNYRYAPPRTQVKELLMSGVIGDVLSVQFEWLLNVRHGADYFRRWHRNKENSGSLMVHKATHHFDLVNWWLSTVPETVFAMGHRHFYTPETAERYGLTNRGERCHGCPESDRCRFHLDLAANDNQRRLYLEAEGHDGYFRDRCVFSDKIDIEDNMNVIVGYQNGVKLSYSLNAFLPWEGYQVTFNGTRGRLEHKCEESVYTNADGAVPGALKKDGTWTRIYPHWEPAYSVDIWEAKGGHGGADPVMLKYIFDPESQPEDKYQRPADQRSGAWSILTGIAANHSMAENRPVRINELVSGIGTPDYPDMPSKDESLG